MPGDFAESVLVAADGEGKASFKVSYLTFNPVSPNSVFGRTIVVHELADDQMSDPSGASGKRIACGQIPTLGTP